MNDENNNTEKSSEPVVDCYAVVKLEEKNVSATIEVVPPRNGGKEVTLDLLKAALDEAGVCYGLKNDAIKEIAENKIYNRPIVIAEYTPATNGTDGTITYKFDKFVAAVPVENDLGIVDYRELGQIRSITAGTVIAEVTLPIDGEPGRDVLDREIAPNPPKKAAFSVGVGTVLSIDGTTLTAAVDGHLVYDKNAFTVRKVLVIKSDIDFNTGNIEFLSDINIQGNVGEGFKVVSTGGNVTIQGGIFSGSLIKATGNITLKQVANHATVEAGGDVTANFCEYCNIKAEGDITASTLVICDVYCGGTLTTKGSKTGGLVGGRYTVLTGLNVANNIGSPNYPTTIISLGDNTILDSEREKLLAVITKRENELTDLTMIIDYLNAKKKMDRKLAPEKEELLGDSVKKRIIRSRDIKTAKERVEEINNLLENRQDLRFEVMGSIYPKTKININTLHFEIMDEWKRVKVFVDEFNEFHFEPI
ncbi:MAG: FapA family protein [Ruminococcus sp.]|nr:FapA family protein [Ruminococcus sp.]